MIEQVIDKSVLTLNYPHRSSFMGDIWIAGNSHFFLCYSYSSCSAYNQNGICWEEWACSIFTTSLSASCSDVLKQLGSASDGKARVFPVAPGSRHFMLTEANSTQRDTTNIEEHQSSSERSEPVQSLFSFNTLVTKEVFPMLQFWSSQPALIFYSETFFHCIYQGNWCLESAVVEVGNITLQKVPSIRTKVKFWCEQLQD